MDCVQSLLLLSDYHDGSLDEEPRSLIIIHLEECPPCMGIFKDLQVIVTSATVIRGEDGITFPDENLIWQRMQIIRTSAP